ncbi:hypothetical protein SanaruYs_36150 [Chryseotalea sanaruensis]|uniref:Uncharacterized protein n=1 Tax=Chryseotalea sanaruensis TaxID=2482724 RepID=A0A401UES8_9BACT|nr:hypothetical protein SanaruYs_36150 [Chryseotalea sanaruensis]
MWFISLVLTSAVSFAQVEQIDRFEVPINYLTSGYEVTSLLHDGILLHRVNSSDLSQEFEIIKLDTLFNQRWRGAIPFDKNFTITHKKFFKNSLYILARGNSYYDFILIKVDQETGRYTQYKLRNYIPFVPSEFQVNDRLGIIGGYFNKIPIVVLFDFELLRLKILPGLFNEIGELAQIKVHQDNTFDILLCARYFNREKTIWIKSYTPEGDFIIQKVLPTDGNKSLVFGRINQSVDDTKIVAGVYGNRNSEYSKGLFVAAIDPFGDSQVKYYNFADLENFFSYMKINRQKRVKYRIDKRKNKGKENRFNYRLLVHELVPYKDQFILLGEAFYPKYKSIDRSISPGFFSRSGYGYSGNSEMIFDGYRYTHATVLAFDVNGKLQWDNTFEINDVKTFNLEQFVKLKTDKERITLLYLFDNMLRTKIISGSNVIESKNTEPIKTLTEGDVVINNQTVLNKLEYWYGDYLFAYGIQNVTNTKQIGGQSERSVFFINKLKCR